MSFSSVEADDPRHYAQLRDVAAGVADRPVAVVTGCSSGIGLHVAAMLAVTGKFRVVATMRNPSGAGGEALRSLCATYRERCGSQPRTGDGEAGDHDDDDEDECLRILPMDVTDEQSVARVVSQLPVDAKEQRPRVDVLVNNAGYGVSGNVEQVSVGEAQQLFDVNVFGVMRTVQAFAPLMRARRHGVIVQVSSTAGVRGIPFSDVYAASKFALEGLSESMRYYLQPCGVSVTCVNPGPARTSFVGRYGRSDRGSRRPLRYDDGDGGGGGGGDDGDAGSFMDHMHEQFVQGLSERMRSEEGQSSAEVALEVVKTVVRGVRSTAGEATRERLPMRAGTSKQSRAAIRAVHVDPDGWQSEPYRRFWQAIGYEPAQQQP